MFIQAIRISPNDRRETNITRLRASSINEIWESKISNTPVIYVSSNAGVEYRVFSIPSTDPSAPSAICNPSVEVFMNFLEYVDKL